MAKSAQSKRNCEIIIEEISFLLKENSIENERRSKSLNTTPRKIKRQQKHFLAVNKLLFELFTTSNRERKFWYDCSLDVYKGTLPNRLKEDIQNNSELEFLKNDYIMLDNPAKARFFNTVYSYSHFIMMDNPEETGFFDPVDSYNDYITNRSRSVIEDGRKQKLDFLRKKILDDHHKVILRDGEQYNLHDFKEFIPLDANLAGINKNGNQTDMLYEQIPLKATEKIIYLQRLGLLDFLKSKKPFNTSTNALAGVIGAFTEIDKTYVQSMINPILSSKVDQKNNPLNTKKTLERVEAKLIQIGFNPPK